MVEIDESSGFCFGVTTAIQKAEEELEKSGTLYCLGDIVHNSDEVERLRQKGLVTITHEQMADLHDVKVLLRAHGEPPSTYELAKRNNIEIIDATCPVVLRLQQRIKAAYDQPSHPQIVIYGKIGHAEVNGLVGQTAGDAIVVENDSQLDKIDFNKDIALYSQTTKSLEGFQGMISAIGQRKAANANFKSFDTICRQVASRVEHLKKFAQSHATILFVAGAKSSNGRILYGHCKDVNPSTYLVSNAEEIDPEWVKGSESIGICGATSTPRWLMEKVRERVGEIVNSE
ncbi:MAG: 4-hydroxy-3-methylbut-2-enyl diphosphate reductase [Bacteroidales bacterium]|nr:4-hydroxy-3-methylbut-2-enyl diphosphate reductase [Bacteroidales bacterium]